MDANQLFWATGIDNTKLNTNVNEAVAIFQKLSNNVKAELEKIERYYDKVQLKANLKFTNPVDPSMVASIREQMASLGKVIDDQTVKVANLSMTYDKAMSKISSSASKLGKGCSNSSPISGSVDNVKADVARADKELSFLERRFKYAASSIIAYGSFRWGKQFIDDMISVKGEFDQLRVAIDAFTGSSEKGAEIFGQLTRLAVKSPFELRDITNSAKQLLAYGTAADDVTNSVKMLSDVSAGSGQSIKDIAYLYGTSLTQGRLYARDLFQFANRGIPIYGELAKVMGVSTEKLMQLTKAGKVGFPELQKAVENMTAAGGKYYGLSDKLAETTYGKISNLKDKWSIALNEMGTQTDGIVSTGVQGITALIANWEEVAKAIEGVVLAYGSYKAATAVGALVAGVETYAANYREAESLNILTTAQQRADLAKKGFVLGSVEYTAAIKAEAAAQLQNAQASVVAADEQIVSLNALVISKSAELLESEKIVLAKRAELEASILLGNQKAIEAAQTNLSAAIGDKDTIASEANTLSTELNTLMTEKQTIADKIELITTVQDTAAKAANTGSTNLLTAAKAKLTAMAARLNAVIAANPWTVAAIAIGLLVYAVWELYDATTDAEKAQKKFNASIENQNRILEETERKTKELVEVIKSETSTRYDKEEALLSLQKLMPLVFKNMDIETIKMASQIGLLKQIAQWKNIEAMSGAKASVMLRQKELEELKAKEKIASGATLDAVQNLIKQKEEEIRISEKYVYKLEDIKQKAALKSLPKQQQIQSLSINKKAIESEIRDLEDRKKVAQKNNEFFSEQYKLTEKRKQLSQIESQIGSLTSKDSKKIKDKGYWDNIKKNAEEERNAMDISEVNGKRWNELVEQERNADKQLAAWDSSSKMDKRSESAKTKAQKEAERQAKLVQEQNRLNNEILQNKEKLADASKQAELDRAQAEIDVLEDGYSKKQAQIEANYNREIAKVKEKGDELLKVQQKIAYDQWIIANPNWVKEKKSFTMPATLSPDNQKTVTSLTGTAEMNRANESKKMYEKLLIDLQNFDQQRIEIDKKYNDQISYLNKKRVDDNKIDLKNITDENKSSTDKRIQDRNIETDKAIAEAGRLAKESKAKISIEELQKEINWGDVFSDLDKMSTDSLTKVRDKIKVLISNINGDASKVDIKEVVKALDNLDEKLSERDSFTAIKTSIDEYSKATKKAAASQVLLNKLSKEGKKGTKEYSDAETELGKNQNDRVKASAKMTKSFEDIKKKTDGLSSSFKSLGDSIGGALGEGFTVASQIIDITMQGIGGIVSLVNTSATAMKATSTSASIAIQTIEKASVILAIISAAIQLAMVVINLFNGKSKEQKYYEKLKKELEAYLSVLDKTIESQKEFMNTFTGYEAISSFEKVKKSIESQIEAYRKLAAAAGAVSGKARDSTHNLASGGSSFDGNRYISYLKQISYLTGININKVEDLYKLTPEQLRDIRDNNAYAWSLINEDIRNYLDDIITAGKALTEATNQANEALLGLSFDSAKDGLDDLLKSSDTTMSQIAGNFEDYMRNAMLSIVKGNYLTKELQGWYDKFVADTTSGNELTNEEVDSLRQAYIDIYKNAQSQYDALLDAADITLTGSANSTSGAISSMSQESADILTAQFSAIRINVSDILLTLQSERPLLELAFNDIAEIARNTRDLADIKRLIGDIKDYGVKMK